MDSYVLELNRIDLKNTDLVSVIVPVYNCKDYVSRCVESIMDQTYKNLEIIIVNDGSTDETLKIVDELAKRDNRIKIIDKENGGLSSARNAGISVAKGNYISFVDGDDWIEPDTYELALKVKNKTNADIVSYGIKQVSSYEIREKGLDRVCINSYYNDEIMENYMRVTTQKGGYSVCKCLFKAQTIDGLKFREGKVNEDIEYKFDAISNSKIFALCESDQYYYFQSGNSLSLGKFKVRDFDLLDAAERVELKSRLMGKDINRFARIKVARTYLSWLCKVALYGVEDNINKTELINRCTTELRKRFWLLITSPMKVSRKVLLILFATNYNCTEKIIRVASKFVGEF